MIIVESFGRGGAPRGATARSRGQGHDAMTPIITSSQLDLHYDAIQAAMKGVFHELGLAV